ncbi:MAG: single-stranded DNA-binding protein [Verrucomicrobia bacterium]|jgi:single-strand DNA-binding protein|nr:single-stranded DNA-binding protein [Verrucomicrobiota bacterium]
MANLNRVLLIGNLTRDPEIRYTPKGTAVAEIGLAVNRVYSGEDGERKEETTFVDVTLWARQAEVAGQYLKKGRPVFIEGRLQLDSWEDKQTGQKRSRLRVVGENLQLLGSRQDAEGTSPSAPPRRSSVASPSSRPEPRDPDLDAEPDDIPF